MVFTQDICTVDSIALRPAGLSSLASDCGMLVGVSRYVTLQTRMSEMWIITTYFTNTSW
jgi:hypothetical protein